MVSDLVFCSSWQEGFGWFWIERKPVDSEFLRRFIRGSRNQNSWFFQAPDVAFQMVLQREEYQIGFVFMRK